MLFIKDKFNISAGAYHEMVQLYETMPWHYQLKQCIAELNRLWNIYPTANGTCGAQQSLKQHIQGMKIFASNLMAGTLTKYIVNYAGESNQCNPLICGSVWSNHLVQGGWSACTIISRLSLTSLKMVLRRQVITFTA